MNNRKGKRIELLSFIIPIIFLLLLFYFAHIFPFGNNTIIVNDATNQYISILAYFRNNIFHSPEKLLYSYNLGLGNQFFSVLMYYLFSPINLISLFFPISKLPIFFVLNTLFNAGLMGFTCYYYLTKSKFINENINDSNKIRLLRLIFSSCFSLSTYFMIYNHCEMWFNTIAIFPLLILAFERLLLEKKPIFFAILYPILFISNYYITFIISFFLLILTAFWFILCKKNVRIKIKRLVLLIGITFSGILIGSVSLIPSLMCQKMVHDQENLQIGLGHLYNPFDFIKSILFNPGTPTLIQKGQITYSYTPYVYSSIFILILVIYFFIGKRISKKEKLVGISLLGILFFCSWNITLYEIWHGFTWPHGYPQRESFIILFVLIILAYRALVVNINSLQKDKLVLYIIGFVILALTIIFNLRSISLIFLGIILILGFTSIIIYLNSKFAVSLIFLIMFFTIDVFSTNYKLINQTANQSINIISFKKAYKNKNHNFEKLKEKDKSFYRIGTATEMNCNDPLLFDYNGLSNYVSQQQTSVINYMSSVGYLIPKNQFYRWIEYNNGSTYAMDSLLGIKYYINDISDSQNIIDTKNTMRNLNYNSGNGIKLKNTKAIYSKIYKNNSYFPLVFSAPKAVTEKLNLMKSSSENPFKNQNKIWNKFGEKLYSKADIKIENESADSIDYKIDIKKTGKLYWYLPFRQSKTFSLKNNKQSPAYKIKVNNEEISNVFSNYSEENKGQGLNSENGIVCLGEFQKGQKINLQIIKLGKGNLLTSYTSIPYVYTENQNLLDDFKEKYVILGGVKNINISDTSISFQTNKNFSQEGVLLTLPYDNGWHIKVNGERVVPKKAFGTFIYINLDKKKINNVKLSYRVPGLKLSMLLALIGLLLDLLIILHFSKIYNVS